ncbi:MAG: hypothetical protein NXI24_20495 [bacterium]|nr:hypothetical protein [bacterium]
MTQQPPQPQARYSFLEILSESEGLARGANLSEKINHGVYKAIQSMTTVAHARRNQLFTLDTEVPDIINLTRKDLGVVVGRLIGDRLVAQIFRLEFDPVQSEPALVSCYLSDPADEKTNPALIYNETVMASVQALESLLDARPPALADAILEDLEADFETEVNRPLALPCHLVDLFGAVHASKFDMVPAPELVQKTIADIQAELLYRGKIQELLNYGLMPMRDSEIMLRLDTAIDFLDAKIIPRYKNKGSLKRALEAIAMEESAYHLDDFVPPTPEFAMRRAEAVRAAIQADPAYRGGRFQGGLAIEVILALAPHAKQKYLERHQREIAQAHKDFREKLINISNDWQDTILFLSVDEREKIPPEVVRELEADPELLTGTWHRREGIVYVYIRSSADAIRAIVRALSIVTPDRAWQALAVKHVLEEHEDDFRYLFEDTDFLVSYGSMLRRVYINYIPWYLRLLLSFGITWFQDLSFQVAKKAIQVQQGSLAVRNRQRSEERKIEKDEERQAEMNRIREASAANQIVEQLDAAFFAERGRVPSLGDIQDAVAAHAKMEEATFQEMLRKHSFQIAPPAGKDAGPRDAILLYPLNHEWRTRAARLRRVLERITTDENADPLQSERAKRVQKYLGKIESGGGAKPVSAPADESGEFDDSDAFERFGTELDKHEKRKKRKGSSDAAGQTPPELDDADAPEL